MALLNAKTTKEFSIEATRYIIDLEESHEKCAGKVAAIAKWRDEVIAEVPK